MNRHSVAVEQQTEVTRLLARVWNEATVLFSTEFALALFEESSFPEMSEWASEVQRLNDAGQVNCIIAGDGSLCCVATDTPLVRMLANFDARQARAFSKAAPTGAVRVFSMFGDTVSVTLFGAASCPSSEVLQ
jgi:hypothetical protein